MGMKPGYKQTEVGLLPEEWDAKALGDVCTKIQDGTHFSPAIRGGEYLYVTSKNIGFGKLDVTDAPRIDEAQHRAIYRRCDPKRGDLLLTKDGASTGNAALNTLDEEFSLLSSVALLRFDPQADDASFFLQQILSSDGQRRIKGEMSGNAITRLTLSKINRLKFPICELAEQRAIATALSDVDALLEGLDRLIAKKRDLKQAAMQQLLTGQTRLPGFEGEWDMRQLADVADIRSGGTPRTKNPAFWNGGLPWCTPTDITALQGGKYLSRTERTISHAGLRASSAEVIPPNSVIMTTRATIGECAINKVHMTTNQGFKNLIPSTADAEFLYYLMTTQKDRLIQLCGGSTFLEVGKKQLQRFEVTLPIDLEEQRAIATVLSNMDAEIEALEQRRAKTAELKQAMMQELLTGRTRLVTPQASTEEVPNA
jgi:type I restriction enzyme, S subunit